MKKIVVTWSDIDSLISNLSLDIRIKDFPLKNIYGSSDDGLIIAVLLSHKLLIPISNNINEQTLIVDSIVDEKSLIEKSINDVNSYLSHNINIYSATLFKREKTSFNPTFVGKVVDYNDWVIFPWEYEIHQIENMQTFGI